MTVSPLSSVNFVKGMSTRGRGVSSFRAFPAAAEDFPAAAGGLPGSEAAGAEAAVIAAAVSTRALVRRALRGIFMAPWHGPGARRAQVGAARKLPGARRQITTKHLARRCNPDTRRRHCLNGRPDVTRPVDGV